MTRRLTTFLQVQAEASRPFEQPIMTNIHRSDYVEAIVSVALRDHGWIRMTPWDSWDFEHEPTGCRLEVKQSAAAQSWRVRGEGTKPRFDIAARTGYWDRGIWKDKPGRPAHIYVFAWHADATDATDQRDLASWVFHVIPEWRLPDQKTIGLPRIRRFGRSCSLDDLAETVNAVREQIAEGSA